MAGVGLRIEDAPPEALKKYWYINKFSVALNSFIKYPINKKGRIFTIFTFLIGFAWIALVSFYEPFRNAYIAFGGLIAIAAITGSISYIKTYKHPGPPTFVS